MFNVAPNQQNTTNSQQKTTQIILLQTKESNDIVLGQRNRYTNSNASDQEARSISIGSSSVLLNLNEFCDMSLVDLLLGAELELC